MARTEGLEVDPAQIADAVAEEVVGEGEPYFPWDALDAAEEKVAAALRMRRRMVPEDFGYQDSISNYLADAYNCIDIAKDLALKEGHEPPTPGPGPVHDSANALTG